MLILSYSYAFWVYLYQFCQRVHKSSGYRHSPSYCHILVWELVPCSLRCRVYRCAILANNVDVGFLTTCYVCHGTFENVRSLPACRTVADSHSFNAVFPCQSGERWCCFQAVALGWEGIYYIVIQQVSLLIEHNHLASSPDAWVYSHHAFLSERRIKEQLPEVSSKHFNGFCLCLLPACPSKLILHAWCEQALVRVVNSLSHKLWTLPSAMYVASANALQSIVADNTYVNIQYAVSLTTPHRQ